MTEPQPPAFRHILVPTDFGDCARHALDIAVEIANRYGALVTLVHAHEGPFASYPGLMNTREDLTVQLQEAASGQLAAELAELRCRVARADGRLCTGTPWKEIVSAIEATHADLVVMGTHGRRGLDHLLIGSVAERVLRHAPVPVLTVK